MGKKLKFKDEKSYQIMFLSSQNKKILVFSDVHQDIKRAKYILEKENYDIVICLGDWFDSYFYNKKEDVIATCNFLKEWIFKENFYTIFGNHDLPLLYNNPHALCGGFEQSKKDLIIKEFGKSFEKIRDKFLWYIFIDDYLCTHAGLSERFLPYYFDKIFIINKENISNFLKEEAIKAETSLLSGMSHWIYRAGFGRGGSQKVGGLTWLDYETEFERIENLPQIFGHSFNKTIQNKNNNWNIDCNLSEYLLIENGKITIKKFIDL
jgi:hypothetical protein